MTLIIVFMLILGYLLIATGHLTGVNKAAIAMFIGTVGWVVYVCWGADFVMSQHPHEYAEFLGGDDPSSSAVKLFIYDSVFLKYVGRAASIVMFLIATMTIIEILNNNGCFDFITEAPAVDYHSGYFHPLGQPRQPDNGHDDAGRHAHHCT